MAVQRRGPESVCYLSGTCGNLSGNQRPHLSRTGRCRLVRKVALHGGYDKSPEHAEHKSPGKGAHSRADAGGCFGI